MRVLLLLTIGLATPAQAVEYRFYHPDPVGSNTVVTDRSGALVQRTVFSPYGVLEHAVDENASEVVGTQASPRHLFTGQERDPESELGYFGARYYDPATGRFLSTDPALTRQSDGLKAYEVDPTGFNGHSYVVNRPTRWVDPSGRMPESPLANLGGILSPEQFRAAAEAETLQDPDVEPGDLNPVGLVRSVGKLAARGSVRRTVKEFFSDLVGRKNAPDGDHPYILGIPDISEPFNEFTMAGFDLLGRKKLKGDVFEVSILGLKAGTDPSQRSVFGLLREIESEARAAGAKSLTVFGIDVQNRKFIEGGEKLAKRFGFQHRVVLYGRVVDGVVINNDLVRLEKRLD